MGSFSRFGGIHGAAFHSATALRFGRFGRLNEQGLVLEELAASAATGKLRGVGRAECRFSLGVLCTG